jgi:hypothetical protein
MCEYRPQPEEEMLRIGVGSGLTATGRLGRTARSARTASENDLLRAEPADDASILVEIQLPVEERSATA